MNKKKWDTYVTAKQKGQIDLLSWALRVTSCTLKPLTCAHTRKQKWLYISLIQTLLEDAQWEHPN